MNYEITLQINLKEQHWIECQPGFSPFPCFPLLCGSGLASGCRVSVQGWVLLCTHLIGSALPSACAGAVHHLPPLLLHYILSTRCSTAPLPNLSPGNKSQILVAAVSLRVYVLSARCSTAPFLTLVLGSKSQILSGCSVAQSVWLLLRARLRVPTYSHAICICVFHMDG